MDWRGKSCCRFCTKSRSFFGDSSLNSTIPELPGSGWLAAEPEATPQTHRLRPWGFPTVSPSHPSVFPHHGIQRITVEFSEESRFRVDNSGSCAVGRGGPWNLASAVITWLTPYRHFKLRPGKVIRTAGEKSLFRYQHFHRDQPMKGYNPPSRIGLAARSVQEGQGMEPRPMERFCFATIIVATLMLHGFEPLPCRAQAPSLPSPAGAVAAGPAAPANSASPAGERLRGP